MKFIKYLLLLLVTIVLLMMTFFGYQYYKISNTVNKINKNSYQIGGTSKKIEQQKGITVLLEGIDTGMNRQDTQGRSDAIVLMTINPETEQTVMLSVPRDTYTDIVGHNSKDKINHAYAFGGIQMSINSLEKLFDIKVDYYLTTNMDAFADIIKQIDGVTVTSNATFSKDNFNFIEGQSLELDEKSVLAYTRARMEEGSGGDFGRQQRQQQVITAIAKKLASVENITNISTILTNIAPDIKTNINTTDAIKLLSNYRQAAQNVQQYTLEGTGKVSEDNGVYYFYPSDEALLKVKEALKNNLK